MYAKYFKRWIDFTLAFFAFLVLMPLMLVICIAVKISMGSPVIFHQERVGKDEKIFTIYKFRTMKNAKKDKILTDEERITRLGGFLRTTSLDELPELVNIIKGDLAIVGPRPLLSEYLPYYTDRERTRHKVRSGLTQPEVLYNKVFPTWDEQLEYEAEYAEHITFFVDMKIIFKTVQILFGRCQSSYGEQIRKSLIEERTVQYKHENDIPEIIT